MSAAAAAPTPAPPPKVALIAPGVLGLAGESAVPAQAATAQIAALREQLSTSPRASALLPEGTDPDSPDIDHLLTVDVPAHALAAAARRRARPLLSLHAWPARDGVWSELIEATPDGRITRLVGGCSMMRAHAPARSLAIARRRSIDFVRRWFDALPQSLAPEAAGTSPPPALGRAALALQTGRALLDKALERLRRQQQWVLFVDRPTHPLAPIDFARGTPILPPRDSFWADPFPVTVDGRHYCFFEALPFATQRGHLSVLEILPDGQVTAPVIVLQRPYHLSYPYVFPWDGQWYLMPETSENQRIEVYRCERWPDRWTLHAEHFVGEAMADPSLVEHDGRWWLFATRRRLGETFDDELCLYHGPTPLGPWTAHAANPIVDDARWARPAGRPLVVDGRLLRPAQNCGRAYGESLSIREITTLTPTRYAEREVVHLQGDSRHGMLRVHTLNLTADLRVVDAMRLI